MAWQNPKHLTDALAAARLGLPIAAVNRIDGICRADRRRFTEPIHFI